MFATRLYHDAVVLCGRWQQHAGVLRPAREGVINVKNRKKRKSTTQCTQRLEYVVDAASARWARRGSPKVPAHAVHAGSKEATNCKVQAAAGMVSTVFHGTSSNSGGPSPDSHNGGPSVDVDSRRVGEAAKNKNPTYDPAATLTEGPSGLSEGSKRQNQARQIGVSSPACERAAIGSHLGEGRGRMPQ